MKLMRFLGVIFLLCSHLTNGQTFTNTSPNSFIDGTVYSTTFTVNGVDADKVLKQITLNFGDGGQYAGDLTRANITLTNPAGTTVTVLNPASFNNSSTITDANRRYANITLRDHAGLNTPGEYLTATGNTLSNAYPLNYGYWRVPVQGSFSNFDTDHNGEWTLTISYPGLSTTSGFARKYVSSKIVFDVVHEVVDIIADKPNQSCDTKQCMETGKVYLATNSGYPNGQPNIPLTIDGCQWNLIQNNASWFYFIATSTTVKLSISGFTKKIESVVVKSEDCQNYTLVNGGCPTTMYNGSANPTQYYNQNYAGGYSQNHGYTLTGLTIGEEYILVLDGLDQAPQQPTSSNFYIEIEEGADDGCCSNTTPIFTFDDVICQGSETLPELPTTSNNGITGTWDPPVINGNITTDYTFTPDDTECHLDTTITITIAPLPELIVSSTDPSCGNTDGEINISATNGTPPYTYSIDDGVTTQNDGLFTDLSAGTYNILVTDDNGCSTFYSESLQNADGVAIDEFITTDPSCGNSDGSIEVITSGGGTPYTYQWYDSDNNPIGTNSNTINNLDAGTYTVEITDANDCVASDQIELINAGDVEDASFSFNNFCEGSSNGAEDIVTPGGTFSFNPEPSDGAIINPSTGEITNSTANGTYTVQYTTSGDCPGSSTVEVTVYSNPTYTATTVSPSCGENNGSITITASGGSAPYTYSINGGNENQTGSFTNLSAGTYDITIIDNNGCETNGIEDISNADGPTINDITATDASCNGNDGSIIVTASGGEGTLTYSINNGTPQNNNTFTGLTPGTYSITVEDENGCVATGSATIGQADSPSITISNKTDVSCEGANDGSITVSTNGGTPNYNYSWNPPVSTSNSASNLSPGTYEITVTDEAGCTDVIQVNITEPTAIQIQTTVNDAICGMNNGSITVTATGGVGNFSYNWSPNVSSSNIASNLAAGNYQVIVTDGNGCSETVSVEVGIEGSFPINVSPDVAVINEGESVDIELTVDPNVEVEDITWVPTDGLNCSDCDNPTATPDATTTYYVFVTDVNGCTSQDSVLIIVEPPCTDIFVPNVFSPNSDGTNDFQCVFGSCIVAMDFNIFNRWGEKVFNANDRTQCWDGTFRGKFVQSGVYFYTLTGTLKNGEQIKLSGDITVVR